MSEHGSVSEGGVVLHDEAQLREHFAQSSREEILNEMVRLLNTVGPTLQDARDRAEKADRDCASLRHDRDTEKRMRKDSDDLAATLQEERDALLKKVEHLSEKEAYLSLEVAWETDRVKALREKLGKAVELLKKIPTCSGQMCFQQECNCWGMAAHRTLIAIESIKGG